MKQGEERTLCILEQLARYADNPGTGLTVHSRLGALLRQLPRVARKMEGNFIRALDSLREQLEIHARDSPLGSPMTANASEALLNCEKKFLVMAYPTRDFPEEIVSAWLSEETVEVLLPRVLGHWVSEQVFAGGPSTFKCFFGAFRKIFKHESIEYDHCLTNFSKNLVLCDPVADESSVISLEETSRFLEFFFGNIQGITRYRKLCSVIASFKQSKRLTFEERRDIGSYSICLTLMPKRLDENEYIHKGHTFIVNTAGAEGTPRYCADQVVLFGRGDPYFRYYDVPFPDLDDTMDEINAVILNRSPTQIFLIDTSTTGNVCVRLPATLKNWYSIDGGFPLTEGSRISLANRIVLLVENIKYTSRNPGEHNGVPDADAEDSEDSDAEDNYGNVTDHSVLTLRHLNGADEGATMRLKTQDWKLDNGAPPAFDICRPGQGTEGGIPKIVDQSGVSRVHCRFVFMRNTWFVRDLGSANGTYIYLKTAKQVENREYSAPFELFGTVKHGHSGEQTVFSENEVAMGPYWFKIQSH